MTDQSHLDVFIFATLKKRKGLHAHSSKSWCVYICLSEVYKKRNPRSDSAKSLSAAKMCTESTFFTYFAHAMPIFSKKKKLLYCSYNEILQTHTKFAFWVLEGWIGSLPETLPKAQRTRGLSSTYQSNFFGSYDKFKHKSWSNFIFIISTKHQLQNSN